MRVVYLSTVYANRVSSPKPYLDAVESAESVRSLGFLPQQDALRQLETPITRCCCATAPARMPESLRVSGPERPILAVAPPASEAAQLLRRAGTGVILDPGVPASTRAGLPAAFERFERIRRARTGT
jgi:hypothetical protein